MTKIRTKKADYLKIRTINIGHVILQDRKQHRNVRELEYIVAQVPINLLKSKQTFKLLLKGISQQEIT